jgi:transposase InsO family protein
VVDALRRKVVGWAIADHLRTELVLDAVGIAVGRASTRRKPPAGTVHHTDRGSQYTSYEFGKTLRASAHVTITRLQPLRVATPSSRSTFPPRAPPLRPPASRSICPIRPSRPWRRC